MISPRRSRLIALSGRHVLKTRVGPMQDGIRGGDYAVHAGNADLGVDVDDDDRAHDVLEMANRMNGP